jgi:hypothetical protein
MDSATDDIPLLLSQPKHNWSSAADEADVDSAIYNVVAQCGAGGWTSSRHIRDCREGTTLQYGLHRLIHICYHPKQSIVAH